MKCHACAADVSPDDSRCPACGTHLAIAVLEVVTGNLSDRIHFLKAREYRLGRAQRNDIVLAESSISKDHARIWYEDGRFRVEDVGSRHGVHVNASKVDRADLVHGATIQMGNVSLRFALLGDETTAKIAEFPWIEQQQLLLSLIQPLNSTLVLSEVLGQVLDAVMRITKAERGYILLYDESPDAARYESIAGLRLRVGRQQDGRGLSQVEGISVSSIRRALESGTTIATGNAFLDPQFEASESIRRMDLRTIVCIPLAAPPRNETLVGEKASNLGVIYVDNHVTSAPFSPDSLKAAEALARHAAMAIDNARLFEREQRTIQNLRLAQRQILQSEKLATIGQMAAGVAHELNTPLAYMLGNLELLQLQPLTQSQGEMIKAVQQGAERIRDMAQRLLDFSRPSQDAPAPVSPNRLIDRALDLCYYQIRQAGVTLQKRLGEDVPEVLGIANQLEMALTNLILNAVQAMSRGGTLTISSGIEGEQVLISVADTGTGIPDKIRDSLFEPFVTTKPAGKGTGLGLSTVLMIVESHKGHIDFTSEAGVGTTFRILLPILGEPVSL